MQLHQPNNPSTVSFSASFGNNLKLVEVPEDVLKLVLSGNSLSIVGNDSDAVLCTSDRTYSIKRVEYSNSVYFLPPSSNSNYSIESSCTDYYEVKIVPGKLDAIDTLLSETVYRGASHDVENPVDASKLVRRSDLSSTVQASPVEIDAYLKRLGVVETGGYLRLLSKVVIQETIQQLFLSILSEGWSIDSVDESVCATTIPDVDSVVLRHVLQLLGSKAESGLWQLNLNEVLKASAHLIFKHHSTENKILRSSFFHEWFQQTPGVPNESALDENLLKGIALKEEDTTSSSRKNTTEASYRYLPVTELSRDAKIRFKQLFDVKPKFVLEELEPYLQDLCGGVGQPKSIAELLLQYTNNINGAYSLK